MAESQPWALFITGIIAATAVVQCLRTLGADRVRIAARLKLEAQMQMLRKECEAREE
jgi:hypothetical protein